MWNIMQQYADCIPGRIGYGSQGRSRQMPCAREIHLAFNEMLCGSYLLDSRCAPFSWNPEHWSQYNPPPPTPAELPWTTAPCPTASQSQLSHQKAPPLSVAVLLVKRVMAVALKREYRTRTRHPQPELGCCGKWSCLQQYAHR